MIRSLNRAHIMALPGIAVDDGVLGKRGYELLSAEALRRDIAALAPRLGLDPAAPALLHQFDASFENPETRPYALQVARRYGRRLGYLLLMLRRGDAPNRAARPAWSDEHWSYWQTVNRIYVGGGLIAGNPGRHAIPAARHLLAECGVTDLALDLSPHAAHLPLVGLARAAPRGATAMLLLDFGQTSIKRGLATYEDHWLTRIELLPPAPSVCDGFFQPEPTPEEAGNRWHRMLEVIEESWSHLPPSQRGRAALAVSLACYLPGGHPSPTEMGCYGSLQLLCNHLETFMRDKIAARLNVAPPFVLMHDGTAAATTYAGSGDAAVITLGTAIGVGFPPPEASHRPIHPEFRLL